MWRAVGLGISPRDGRHLKWPRVSASLEYRRPLRFEDEFDVHLWIVDMGSKTIRYAAVLRRGAELVAEGTLVIAGARPEGERLSAAAISPDIAARFTVAGE